MSNLTIGSFGTTFLYTLNVNSLDSATSEKVILNGVTWIVKFRRNFGNRGALVIRLESTLEDGTVPWSCEAKAIFKILHKDGDDKRTIVKVINFEFSNHVTSRETDEHIDWNDFVRDYVKEEEAKFEVEISTNPLRRYSSVLIEQTAVTFRVVVENVSRLTEACSNDELVRGVRWRVMVKKNGDDFGIYLNAENDDLDINWSWNVIASMKLCPFAKNIDPIYYKWYRTYRWGASSWGCPNLVNFAKLIDQKNKYVANDAMVILVEFQVDTPLPLWTITGEPTAYSHN